MKNAKPLAITIVDESFYPLTDGNWIAKAIRFRTLTVAAPVYSSYVGLYNASSLLAHQLKTVLDHPEHRQLMQMGLNSNLEMPDTEPVYRQIAVLKEILNDLCIDDIVAVSLDGEGKAVNIRIPFAMAVQFNEMAFETAKLVSLAFSSACASHYQSCFTSLKNEGEPYQGPKSVDEIMNAWRTLIRNKHVRNIHTPGTKRLPLNWMECV